MGLLSLFPSKNIEVSSDFGAPLFNLRIDLIVPIHSDSFFKELDAKSLDVAKKLFPGEHHVTDAGYLMPGYRLPDLLGAKNAGIHTIDGGFKLLNHYLTEQSDTPLESHVHLHYQDDSSSIHYIWARKGQLYLPEVAKKVEIEAFRYKQQRSASADNALETIADELAIIRKFRTMEDASSIYINSLPL